jgi:hypothetical protein
MLEGTSGTVAQGAGDLPTLVSGLTISSGTYITVTFPVTVNAGLARGVIITNTATVIYSTTDSLLMDAATVTITVNGVKDEYLYLPLIFKQWR